MDNSQRIYIKNKNQSLLLDEDEIKKSAPVIFNDTTYDALLYMAYTLFGKSFVSVDTEYHNIFISDKIHLHISLNTFKCKASFFSYIVPVEYAFPHPADIRYRFMNLNVPVCLISLSSMLEYIYLKAQENEFIRKHEVHHFGNTPVGNPRSGDQPIRKVT